MAREDILSVRIPDSRLAREITHFVRDSESELLFRHSTRVYFWGALAGRRRGITFDPELLYAAAMFHDIGWSERPWPRRSWAMTRNPLDRKKRS